MQTKLAAKKRTNNQPTLVDNDEEKETSKTEPKAKTSSKPKVADKSVVSEASDQDSQLDASACICMHLHACICMHMHAIGGREGVKRTSVGIQMVSRGPFVVHISHEHMGKQFVRVYLYTYIYIYIYIYMYVYTP